ncbi:uncharacterized protein C8Q71DRAFT_684773, partial [Rhodofomes roseus]
YDGARERRIVTVSQFLKALLAKPCHDITPLEYHHVQHADLRLEFAFKDCFVYFNHFIKATSFEVVNQAYLRLAISRGAALICADNQAGVNIIIPCLFGTQLVSEKVTAIMVQVKNDRRFTTKVQRHLFTAMNPYTCGIFAKDVKDPPPVLRMVFALASSGPAVTSPSRRQRTSPRRHEASAKFTAYDIWCAGAGASTFGVVQEGEQEVIDNILKTLRRPRDTERMYKDDEPVSAVRSMQPLSSIDRSHFERWAEIEEGIGEECELLE